MLIAAGHGPPQDGPRVRVDGTLGTVEVLEQWAPVAIARGFTLVPLTAVMKERRLAQNAAER